jgi:hypothetical protein
MILFFNISSKCLSATGFNACGILYGVFSVGCASPVPILCFIWVVHPTALLFSGKISHGISVK